MGTVSTVSMIGMGVTLLIAIGLPIGLLIYARTKLGANLIWAGIDQPSFRCLVELTLAYRRHFLVIQSV